VSDTGLVYIGKIIDIEPIPDADLIVSATVVCGKGGKWKGVVRKADFVGFYTACIVYLPDSLIPENESMSFMKNTDWRVKMRRFKGAPSEVLILPLPLGMSGYSVGDDLTEKMGVTKYHKPVPAHLQGKVLGSFPSFIPKTDEPNYQNSEGQEYIEKLQGHPYYVTEKCDGSSTTAYKYKGHFGVCSRNWELERDEKNGYWEVALKYNLENKLPEGVALQWETCGYKIQGNPMGLKKIDGFAFSAYYIEKQMYFDGDEFFNFCKEIGFPTVRILTVYHKFDKYGLEFMGEGVYENGHQREGVVVRSQTNFLGHKPISFKVINLNYDKQ
jgi:RNA ligase (TIGR02306 family)